MNTFALTFALLCGCDQVEVEELVLRACVELTVPRKLWALEVAAEIKRQKVSNPDLALTDYLCGRYYQREIDEPLRWSFYHRWDFEERVWLVSRGRLGEQPSAAMRVWLNEEVLAIGRALPAAVKAGVPVRPMAPEKIGVPK